MALSLGELSGVISLDDRPFHRGLDGAQEGLRGFGAKGKVIALAAGAAIAAALADGLANAMNIDKATDKLSAQLGLTGKDSEKAGKAAGKLYANAYGSSMEEVTGAVGAVMSSIEGMRTASEADIEAMTAKVLDLSAAFEIDAGRAAQVAGQMITSGLAKDGVEAADLLAGSLQKVPAAVREDILDAVDEYAPFMANLGIKGEEAMGLLVTASEKGMYGIDKTGDALKEFGIRATDMSAATGGAYEALGLNQEDMSQRLLAGGDTAKQAFGEIIGGLQGMDDPVAQSQAALALFGTPLEDLSVTEIPKFLGAIDPMGDKFDSLKGKADELGKTLNDNTATNLETFKRGLETGIADALNNHVIPAINDAAKWLNNDFIPALEDAGKWIQDNAAWLIPLTAGIVGYVAAIGTMSLLSTVRGWIAAAAAAQWGLNAAMTANPIGLIIAGIAALVAGLIWFFTQTELGKDIVKNVWSFIQTAVSGVVDWFQNTALPIIQGVFRVVGEVFTWLYENIIKPVWDGISTVVNAAWLVIRGIFQLISSVITNVLGPAFTWLYEKVIKPVFDNIGKVIGWVWDNTIKRIIDAWVWIFQNVLGPAVSWLYETIIKPAFDGIGRAISWVWANTIKPVFDTMTGFIQKTIPKAFEDGVGFIKTAWDKIQEIAKAPIRFVINTVINDGLIGAFNTIASILPGIDKLPRVALPPGFRDGGYTGNVNKDRVAGVVHGDEHVIRSESRRKFEANHPGALEHINRTGNLPKGALGAGMPSAMPGEPGYFNSPKIDIMRRVGQAFVRPLAGIDMSGAASAWNGASRLRLATGHGAPGINTGWDGLPSNIYAWAQMGAGEGDDITFNTQGAFQDVSSGMKRAVAIHEIGHVLGLQHTTNHASVMHPNVSSSWSPTAFDVANLQRIYGAPGMPFTPGAPGVGDEGGGFNPVAGIIDGLVKQFKDTFKSAGFIADLAIGIGKKLMDSVSGWVGQKLGLAATGLTPTVYDGGGWLPNTGGPQLVQHNKSKPDAVLSSEQWADIHKLALSGGKAGGLNVEHLEINQQHDPGATFMEFSRRMASLAS